MDWVIFFCLILVCSLFILSMENFDQHFGEENTKKNCGHNPQMKANSISRSPNTQKKIERSNEQKLVEACLCMDGDVKKKISRKIFITVCRPIGICHTQKKKWITQMNHIGSFPAEAEKSATTSNGKADQKKRTKKDAHRKSDADWNIIVRRMTEMYSVGYFALLHASINIPWCIREYFFLFRFSFSPLLLFFRLLCWMFRGPIFVYYCWIIIRRLWLDSTVLFTFA